MLVLQFKSIIFILLFRAFIFFPIWVFNSLSIKLLTRTPLEYTILEKESTELTAILKKKISKTNSKITSKNYLTIGSTTQEVAFEGFCFAHKNKLGCSILVCPKGKFHPYDFNNNKYINPPAGFEEKGKWDLRCYYSGSVYMLFFLNNGNKNFYYQYNVKTMKECVDCFGNELYNYRFIDGKFAMIANDNGYIVLKGSYLNINSAEENISIEDIVNYQISKAKENTSAYFDNSYYLYFFTYNNLSDFISGYSTTVIDLSNDNKFQKSITGSNIITNKESPFNFIDQMEIKEINFIQGTQYIYYKLYNKNKNKNYYGLVNIKLNKIMYNIEEEISYFIPFSTHEMLAISETSAYKLCIIKRGSSCLETCSSGNLILDPTGNKCGTNCNTGKIKLMPEGICINKKDCDLNFYILNLGQTECGVCKYFYPNGEKYKLINTLGCISSTKNSDYYISHLNLLNCKKDYHLEDNECLPNYCYERCEK